MRWMPSERAAGRPVDARLGTDREDERARVTRASDKGTLWCAVERRHSSAGANPARQLSLQPVAVGADDVVGLYLNPPENAVVFSVDEKISVPALDRTQPGLPIKKGRCGTMTHDYTRHGTTTLFAALDVATGAVIGESYRRHRHQEVLRFLKKVEKAVPKEQELHIILDNYATHKHEEVLRWIERGKRIFLHFIPPSSSWLNMVERFFRTLTDRQIRRGVSRQGWSCSPSARPPKRFIITLCRTLHNRRASQSGGNVPCPACVGGASGRGLSRNENTRDTHRGFACADGVYDGEHRYDCIRPRAR